MRAIWLLSGLAVTSCRLDVDYGGSMYACEVSTECPAGQTCMAGFCHPVSKDAAPVNDAEPRDAGPSGADAASGPDAAWPPNLLRDPSFESSEDEWFGDFASISRTDVKPHTGDRSLFVCNNTGQQSRFGVHREVIDLQFDRLAVGARFHAEVWVRASQSLGQPAPETLRAVVRERGGPAPSRDHEGPALAPVTLDWLLITVDATVTDPDRSSLDLRLETGSEPDDSCFAADDAYIARFE